MGESPTPGALLEKKMTASELVVKALKIKTDGPEATETLGCVFCGKTIHPGERYCTWDPGANFTDGPALTHRHDARFQCEYCAALYPVFTKLQRHLITLDGAYPIAKGEHKRWLLETPPEPPFVCVASDTKRAHMIWRTPITRSRDAIFVRISGRLFVVNRPRILAAREICVTLAERTGRKYCSHPFVTTQVSPGRDSDNTLEFGRFPKYVLDVITEEERKFFVLLSPGDIWALGILTGRQSPVTPPLYTDIKQLSPSGDFADL
jgi:CRISPR type IV-associated protein Csf1